MSEKKKTRPGFRERGNRIQYRFTHAGRTYSVTGSTEKECKAKAQELITRHSDARQKPKKDITFEEYLQEWLEISKTHVRPSTHFSYCKKMRMLSELYPLKMSAIERRDVLRVQAHLSDKHATSTVNWLISMLRHIFDSAIADEIIDRNPATKVKALKRTEIKATSTIHRALTREEQKAFFDETRNEGSWYLELFEFMIVTGVRVGEASALYWRDVNNGIHIEKTVANVGKSQYGIQSTKTEAGCRDLPLTASARDILARQRVKVAEHKGVSFTAPDQRIFYPVQSEGYVTPGMIDHAIEYICKQIKMPRFSSHAFRDTYATRCIQQGMQPNTLKKLMGHSKISMTMDLYAQVLPEDMETAMAKVSIL